MERAATDARRKALLTEARKQRLLWVERASDRHFIRQQQQQQQQGEGDDDDDDDGGGGGDGVRRRGEEVETQQDLWKREGMAPGRRVLRFLNEVCGDKLVKDYTELTIGAVLAQAELEEEMRGAGAAAGGGSIGDAAGEELIFGGLAGEGDGEEEGEKQQQQNQKQGEDGQEDGERNVKSSYEQFLDKLKARGAVDVVRAMQQFVSVFRRRYPLPNGAGLRTKEEEEEQMRLLKQLRQKRDAEDAPLALVPGGRAPPDESASSSSSSSSGGGSGGGLTSSWQFQWKREKDQEMTAKRIEDDRQRRLEAERKRRANAHRGVFDDELRNASPGSDSGNGGGTDFRRPLAFDEDDDEEDTDDGEGLNGVRGRAGDARANGSANGGTREDAHEQDVQRAKEAVLAADMSMGLGQDDGSDGVLGKGDPADAIHGCVERIVSLMKDNLLWIKESAEERAETRRCVEKFLFVKLHDHLWVRTKDDVEADEKLHMQMRSLSFLTWEHLDIRGFAGQGLGVLEAPVKALRQMQYRYCPRDKIQAIMNATKLITLTLTATRSDGTLPGADDFLPALILVVKQAHLPYLHSEMKYIMKYSHPTALLSEAGYVMTHVESAVHFLQNVDQSALSISKDDFDRQLAECQARIRQERKQRRRQQRRRGRRALSGEDGLLAGHLAQSEDGSDEEESDNTDGEAEGDGEEGTRARRRSKGRVGSGAPAKKTNAELAADFVSIHEIRRQRRPTPTRISVDVGLEQHSSGNGLRLPPPSLAQRRYPALAHHLAHPGVAPGLETLPRDLRFLGASGAEDLCVGDIPALFAEYHALAQLANDLLGLPNGAAHTSHDSQPNPQLHHGQRRHHHHHHHHHHGHRSHRQPPAQSKPTPPDTAPTVTNSMRANNFNAPTKRLAPASPMAEPQLNGVSQGRQHEGDQHGSSGSSNSSPSSSSSSVSSRKPASATTPIGAANRAAGTHVVSASARPSSAGNMSQSPLDDSIGSLLAALENLDDDGK